MNSASSKGCIYYYPNSRTHYKGRQGGQAEDGGLVVPQLAGGRHCMLM